LEKLYHLLETLEALFFYQHSFSISSGQPIYTLESS